MKKVYFVHDQQENPAPRAQFLEQVGYELRLFTDGNDCLDAIREDKPDVVLLDILIEGDNGFEFCRTLRRMWGPNELPVILTSKIYRARTFRDEAKQAGAQAYFLRPVKLEELAREIADLCGADLPPMLGGEAA